MPATAYTAMFLSSCVPTLRLRTRPASSIANPAAIHITRKPCIRNDSVFRMYCLSAETPACASCAAAGPMSSTLSAAPIPVSPVSLAIRSMLLSVVDQIRPPQQMSATAQTPRGRQQAACQDLRGARGRELGRQVA
jgi:hypothetical protein